MLSRKNKVKILTWKQNYIPVPIFPESFKFYLTHSWTVLKILKFLLSSRSMEIILVSFPILPSRWKTWFCTYLVISRVPNVIQTLAIYKLTFNQKNISNISLIFFIIFIHCNEQHWWNLQSPNETNKKLSTIYTIIIQYKKKDVILITKSSSTIVHALIPSSH